MHQLPKIRDPQHDLSVPGCGPCQHDLIRELHKIHRTLPTQRIDSSGEKFLQQENLFPLLDEVNGGGIFDDLKQ